MDIEKELAMIVVGDPVRDRHTGQYLGKVTEEKVARYLYVDNGAGWYHEVQLEPAPKLTAEEAWTQVPILVLREIKEHFLDQRCAYEDALRAIRHECYKLLGGAGVKVTEEVKGRVRKVIEDVMDLL